MINDVIHPHGYWLFNDPKMIEREHLFSPELSVALASLFQGSSVIDFGCGRGDYVRVFRKVGIDCAGFDGNPYTPEISGGLCQVLDLSQPVSLRFTADWVLSLEVGEHIPSVFETVFLQNVVEHCRRGVVLSWAVPTADDANSMGHVNPQQNGYIEGKMVALGFTRDLVQEGILRVCISYFRCKYFCETLMVYRRGQEKGAGV